MTAIPFFFNQCLDKGRLKRMILWSLTYQGEYKTIQLIENLKTIGFQYATYAGVSLGIDDLSIPPKKAAEVFESEVFVAETALAEYVGNRTTIETLQAVIDSWHRTSENVKQHVIDYFEATNILNPVYMMAFSGARGNVSQVRQLVGLRGLMADAQGDIIGFPIRSNFREGLTVTEYMISCYGARKGVVDTALRTADAGYLTRRLVDVAQHVVVQKGSCGTHRGISLESLKEYGKVVLPLHERLVGRVFASDFVHQGALIARRNQPISEKLASRLSQLVQKAKQTNSAQPLRVRSPLTCELTEGVCQLCYGWSLAQSSLVTLGEAVGIIAGQSIGEPGTQLTMRTFHTGGVFTGEVQGEFRAPHGGWVTYPEPFRGELIRTEYGQIGFLVKHPGTMLITGKGHKFQTRIAVPTHTALFVREGEHVRQQQVIGQFGDGSSRRNERRQTRKIVFSRLSGQVLYGRTGMTETPLEEHTEVYATPLRPQYRVTSKLGTVWILAGDYLGRTSSLLHMYRATGHLLESGALIKRFSLLGNQDGIVCSVGPKFMRSGKPQTTYLLPPLASRLLRSDQELSSVPQHFETTEKALYSPLFTGFFQGARKSSHTGYTFIKTPTHDCFMFNNQQSEDASLRFQLQSSRSGTNAWTSSHKKGELAVTYFPSIFKAAGSGFFWHKPNEIDPARKHGIVYWAPHVSYTFMPLARSIHAYLGWGTPAKVHIPPVPLDPSIQTHRWVLAQQPLCESETLQNVLRTTYSPTYGLVQYKGKFTQPFKHSSLGRAVQPVPARSVVNPLTGRANQLYDFAKLTVTFVPNKGVLHFPFARVNQLMHSVRSAVVSPGWLYFPQPSLFNSGIVQSGVNSSETFQTFTPALIDVQSEPTQKIRRRTQQFYSKIYAGYAHLSVSTGADTRLNLLPSFRNVFALRHPELIQFLLLSTASSVPKRAYQEASQFYVFTHALSPWFYLVQPSIGPSSTKINVVPTFFESALFMGWVYQSERLGLLTTGSARIQTRSLCEVNFNALVRATFVVLNGKNSPYSFDHMALVRRRLALAQTFEGVQLQHKTWYSVPPVWSKQAMTQLLPPILEARVINQLFMTPFRQFATKSTYAFRVVSKMRVPPDTVSTTLSFSALPYVNTGVSHIWSLGAVTKPFQATQQSTLQGPVNTIRLAQDPVITRSCKLGAAGETFVTPKDEVIFLRSRDVTAVALGQFTPQNLLVSVGQVLRYGEELMPGIATPSPGQIFAITPTQVLIRRGQPVLFYQSGSLHVRHKQWINMGHPLVTLTYQRLVTGDIVQGIPKVEQVFEASQSRDAEVNLPNVLRHTFRSLKTSMVLPKATRTSLEIIQRQIIDRIQRIYLSQGVTISDKHFEVVVRQMTSKVRVSYPGDTGLFRGEIMPLTRVEGINAGTWDRKARYAPIISGISATALSSNSFLSAASFQETTRVLTRDAIARKTDFLRGLKERVILGDLIPAGTGLAETIVYRQSAVL